MSESMVERVARAIAAKKMGLLRDTTGANLPDDLWRQAIPYARAAIEALRRDRVEPAPDVEELARRLDASRWLPGPDEQTISDAIATLRSQAQEIAALKAERDEARLDVDTLAHRADAQAKRIEELVEALGQMTRWRDEAQDIAEKRIAELEFGLQRVRGFIRNGTALGYIRMPDPDTPDTAHEVPDLIDALLAQETEP